MKWWLVRGSAGRGCVARSTATVSGFASVTLPLAALPDFKPNFSKVRGHRVILSSPKLDIPPAPIPSALSQPSLKQLHSRVEWTNTDRKSRLDRMEKSTYPSPFPAYTETYLTPDGYVQGESCRQLLIPPSEQLRRRLWAGFRCLPAVFYASSF